MSRCRALDSDIRGVSVQGDTLGQVAYRHRLDDSVDGGVDPQERAGELVRDPTLPPRGATAIPLGFSPTPITDVTWFVAGSIRQTVASVAFTTHTAAEVAATASGPLPTAMGSTIRLLGSMRESTFADWLVTQTAPPPTATASAPAGTEIGAPGAPVSGSIGTTVSSTEFATHTPPSP